MEHITTTQSPAPANGTEEREADSADKVFQDIIAAADLPGQQKKALISLMFGNSPERAARDRKFVARCRARRAVECT